MGGWTFGFFYKGFRVSRAFDSITRTARERSTDGMMGRDCDMDLCMVRAEDEMEDKVGELGYRAEARAVPDGAIVYIY